MKDLIQLMVKELVDFPDEVVVNELEGRQSTVYELIVAKADVGKVIGKRGKTASALRTIVSAAAAKERRRVVLEILD